VKSINGRRDLAQIAWNFINDSLRTTVCLQYAPRCLAAAAAWMAASYLEAKAARGEGEAFTLPSYPPGSDGKWYHAFQVHWATIEAIVQQIQHMYEANKGPGGEHGLHAALANQGAAERMRLPQAPTPNAVAATTVALAATARPVQHLGLRRVCRPAVLLRFAVPHNEHRPL
jgi:hypothetical protein